MLRDLNKNEKFESDEIFTYTKDHLGSVRDITNNNAELVQRHDYTSYGITKLEKDPANPSYEFIENNYTYTAQDYDIETGLTRHGVRWYDAWTGRFLSEDPIGFASNDTNRYRYVFNRPLVFVDTEGEIAHVVATVLILSTLFIPSSDAPTTPEKAAREILIDFGHRHKLLQTPEDLIKEIFQDKKPNMSPINPNYKNEPGRKHTPRPQRRRNQMCTVV